MTAKDDEELRLRKRAKLQQQALFEAQLTLNSIVSTCKGHISFCREQNYTVGQAIQKNLAEAEEALRKIQRLKEQYQDEVVNSLPSAKLSDF